MRQNDTNFTETEKLKFFVVCVTSLLAGFSPYSIVHFFSDKHIGKKASEDLNKLYAVTILLGLVITLLPPVLYRREVKQSKEEQTRIKAERDAAGVERDAARAARDEFRQLLCFATDRLDVVIEDNETLKIHNRTIMGALGISRDERASSTEVDDNDDTSSSSSSYYFISQS